MSDLDPFAPPGAAIAPTPAPPDDFFAVFWRWEKYRLAYNAILLAETLLALTTRRALTNWRFLDALAGLAIIANVCFCAGPVLHGYLWRLGLRGRWVGLAILIAGTLLAMLLAAIALIGLTPAGYVNFGVFW